VREGWNFAFSLSRTSGNSNFILSLPKRDRYLGDWKETGRKSGRWTRDFLAYLRPVRTHAKNVREGWNFAFSLSRTPGNSNFILILPKRDRYLIDWKETGRKSGRWTRDFLAYLRPVRTHAKNVREGWNFAFSLSRTPGNSSFILCLPKRDRYLGDWKETGRKSGRWTRDFLAYLRPVRTHAKNVREGWNFAFSLSRTPGNSNFILSLPKRDRYLDDWKETGRKSGRWTRDFLAYLRPVRTHAKNVREVWSFAFSLSRTPGNSSFILCLPKRDRYLGDWKETGRKSGRWTRDFLAYLRPVRTHAKNVREGWNFAFSLSRTPGNSNFILSLPKRDRYLGDWKETGRKSGRWTRDFLAYLRPVRTHAKNVREGWSFAFSLSRTPGNSSFILCLPKRDRYLGDWKETGRKSGRWTRDFLAYLRPVRTHAKNVREGWNFAFSLSRTPGNSNFILILPKRDRYLIDWKETGRKSGRWTRDFLAYLRPVRTHAKNVREGWNFAFSLSRTPGNSSFILCLPKRDRYLGDWKETGRKSGRWTRDFLAYLRPVRTHAKNVREGWNFAFSLSRTPGNSNFILCLPKRDRYLGDWKETGRKSGRWTRDFLAYLRPVRTHAKNVREGWNFAFSLSRTPGNSNFILSLPKRDRYLGDWKETGRKSGRWTRDFLAYLRPVRTHAKMWERDEISHFRYPEPQEIRISFLVCLKEIDI
jgi:hypothetical protein